MYTFGKRVEIWRAWSVPPIDVVICKFGYNASGAKTIKSAFFGTVLLTILMYSQVSRLKYSSFLTDCVEIVNMTNSASDSIHLN